MKTNQQTTAAALAALAFLLAHAPAVEAQCTPQEAAILASSGLAAGDELGFSVAVSGDTAAVGAYLHDGVGADSGAAYVFERDHGGPNAWGEVAALTPLDIAAGDQFGVSVALSGDFALVGSWLDDDAGNASGSAYLFERDQGGPDNWGQVKKLTASDAEALDGFGISVALQDTTAVVGARLEDELGAQAGAVYVFERFFIPPTEWSQKQKLTALDGAAGDFFGHSVALEGTMLVVGAINDQDNGTGSGSAYVFGYSVGHFSEFAKLVPAAGAAGDNFGFSVAVDGFTAVIGAPSSDLAAVNAGAAFVFEGDPLVWTETAVLTATNASSNDRFGRVAIQGDVALVGAPGSQGQGAGYVFTRDQGGADEWGQATRFEASNGGAGDSFGTAVALSGSAGILGAPDTDVPGSNAGSAYVLDGFTTQAPPFEVAKLEPSDGPFWSLFGSVAVSGDTVLVGAYGDESAYIYERNLGGVNAWGERVKLLPPLTGYEGFGFAVALDGDRAVVGSFSNYIGIAGVAYIFERDQGGADSWGHVATIQPADSSGGDAFGIDVDIEGDTVLVGAQWNDTLAFSSGSAYVFQRDHGGANNWGEVVRLVASDGAYNDWFGRSVALSGDTAVIGSLYDDDNGANSGSAYVFQRDHGGANVWGEVKKLLASEGTEADEFGFQLDLDGDTVVVIAHYDDEAGYRAGSAYVFERDRGGADNWGETRKILASDAGGGGYFGSDVVVLGDVLLVGCGWDDALAPLSGAAYLFVRHFGGTDRWGELVKFTASDGGQGHEFGGSVDLDGTTAAVGARSVGQAYVFDPLLAQPPTTYCPAGLSYSGCQAQLAASGTSSATATEGFDLIATGVEGGKSGLFFFGANGRQANSWGNGSSYQCVVPPVKRGALLAGVGTSGLCDGQFVYDLNARWATSPNQNPGAGALVQAQLWYRDPQNTSNQSTSLSNAIEFSVCP